MTNKRILLEVLGVTIAGAIGALMSVIVRTPEEAERCTKIAAEEIFIPLTIGDRPV